MLLDSSSLLVTGWSLKTCYKTSETINITNKNSNTTIKYVPTDKMRMLVGVTITTSIDSYDVELFYEDNVKD